MLRFNGKFILHLEAGITIRLTFPVWCLWLNQESCHILAASPSLRHVLLFSLPDSVYLGISSWFVDSVFEANLHAHLKLCLSMRAFQQWTVALLRVVENIACPISCYAAYSLHVQHPQV